MKITIIVSAFLISLSAQAILVCPELQGHYVCDDANSLPITIYQYKNDRRVMNYEISNEHFIADGEEHTIFENQYGKVSNVTECDYEKLKIKYKIFNSNKRLMEVRRNIITRIGPSNFEYSKTVIIKSDDVYPDRVSKETMICELN